MRYYSTDCSKEDPHADGFVLVCMPLGTLEGRTLLQMTGGLTPEGCGSVYLRQDYPAHIRNCKMIRDEHVFDVHGRRGL